MLKIAGNSAPVLFAFHNLIPHLYKAQGCEYNNPNYILSFNSYLEVSCTLSFLVGSALFMDGLNTFMKEYDKTTLGWWIYIIFEKTRFRYARIGYDFRKFSHASSRKSTLFRKSGGKIEKTNLFVCIFSSPHYEFMLYLVCTQNCVTNWL